MTLQDDFEAEERAEAAADVSRFKPLAHHHILQPDREPSADARRIAANLREMFLALVHEGFGETQALTVIGHILAANRPEQ